MLITMLQCMASARRDIQRCREFVARHPGDGPADCELEIQRGIEDIRAYPWASRPVAQFPGRENWLRRRTVGRFVIVYDYLQPIYPCVPAAVIIRAVKPIRPPNEADRQVLHPSSDPYGPIDLDGEFNWDDIIATTEADDRAGRFAFNSDDYPTMEEAMKAMHSWIDGICDRAINRVRSNTSCDDKS